MSTTSPGSSPNNSSLRRESLLEVVSLSLSLALLGLTLSLEQAPLPALVMPVLGVSVALRASHVEVSLSEDKLTFWVQTLERAIADSSVLGRRDAQRAAGLLAFGCSAVRRSAPRARLRSLYLAAHGAVPRADPLRLHRRRGPGMCRRYPLRRLPTLSIADATFSQRCIASALPALVPALSLDTPSGRPDLSPRAPL